MTRQLTLSEDRYQTIVEMAAARHQTPDELLAAIVDEAWERACAPYDAAFQNDPDWQVSAREAAARGNQPQSAIYSSTAALFEALGASQRDIEEAQRLDTLDEPPPAAR